MSNWENLAIQHFHKVKKQTMCLSQLLQYFVVPKQALETISTISDSKTTELSNLLFLTIQNKTYFRTFPSKIQPFTASIHRRASSSFIYVTYLHTLQIWHILKVNITIVYYINYHETLYNVDNRKTHTPILGLVDDEECWELFPLSFAMDILRIFPYWPKYSLRSNVWHAHEYQPYKNHQK
mgnify:CR=1 FL=1